MLRTPDNELAGPMDRIMLLALWTMHERAKGKRIIAAGMGRPTFPINDSVSEFASLYWASMTQKSHNARRLLRDGVEDSLIVKSDAVIGYGNPRGDLEPREKMAGALSKWYGLPITAENVIFTVGGAGALRVIFDTFNKRYPNCRIMTPFPHYSLYTGPGGMNNLHPIDVMSQPGYRLTAASFKASLDAADALAAVDGNKVRLFLLCDPNNPLGTIVEESELKEIANILRSRPEINIAIDEAYAEMRLDGDGVSEGPSKHRSLLTIAPDLKDRILLMRSATKALSAAGERMAVLVSFNNSLTTQLVTEHIDNCGHAPRSSQAAFAEAMDKFTERERKDLVNFYKPMVDYVFERLHGMGAAMPDSSYKPTGTFYVVGDFSDLLGLDIPPEAEVALGKKGKAETAEDVAFSLLLKEGVMLAPLQYFGLSSNQAYLRITCSGGTEELTELMDRVEQALVNARLKKQETLHATIRAELTTLKRLHIDTYNPLALEAFDLFDQYNESICNPLFLKEGNISLSRLLYEVRASIIKHSSTEREKRDSAVAILQSASRGYLARREKSMWRVALEGLWVKFISANMQKSKFRDRLEHLPLGEAFEYLESNEVLNSQFNDELKKFNAEQQTKLDRASAGSGTGAIVSRLRNASNASASTGSGPDSARSLTASPSLHTGSQESSAAAAAIASWPTREPDCGSAGTSPAGSTSDSSSLENSMTSAQLQQMRLLERSPLENMTIKMTAHGIVQLGIDADQDTVATNTVHRP